MPDSWAVGFCKNTEKQVWNFIKKFDHSADSEETSTNQKLQKK